MIIPILQMKKGAGKLTSVRSLLIRGRENLVIGLQITATATLYCHTRETCRLAITIISGS